MTKSLVIVAACIILALGGMSIVVAYYIISNKPLEPVKDETAIIEVSTITTTVNTTLDVESCSDGTQNQDEMGVDCGGECPPCPTIACHTDSDCEIGGYEGDYYCMENNVVRKYKTYSCANAGKPDSYCTDFFKIDVIDQCRKDETCVDRERVCQPKATCDDGVRNQDETGIDCGGSCSPCSSSMDAIAQCITAAGAMVYESIYCPICAAQRRAFGSAFKFINNVICEEERDRCKEEGIRGYPTWEINGVKYPGANIKYVRALTGC